MGSDGYNYLSPEERRRPNESELFARVAAELEQHTKLNSLEARGTLSLALKVHHLTPRLWKQHFAHDPLRSMLDRSLG